MTSYKKKLQPALPRNMEMHPEGPTYVPNMAATVAEAVGAVDAVDAVDSVHAVEAVEAVEVVEAEIATRVSAPIAKLTATLQMHAESRNRLRREETTMSAFSSSAGSQATSKSIASPTNV
jgi:hypothetical protein